MMAKKIYLLSCLMMMKRQQVYGYYLNANVHLWICLHVPTLMIYGITLRQQIFCSSAVIPAIYFSLINCYNGIYTIFYIFFLRSLYISYLSFLLDNIHSFSTSTLDLLFSLKVRRYSVREN